MSSTGVIVEYDPDEGEGYIDPDVGDDRIPFDAQSLKAYGTNVVRVGDHVVYDVEGGMAGMWAINVRRIEP